MDFIYFNVPHSGGVAQLPLPATRFQPRELIGVGNFGWVISAFDEVTGQEAAIKFMDGRGNLHNANQAKRSLREIYVFQHFSPRAHPNLVRLQMLLPTRRFADFRGIYMVMEMAGKNLSAVLKESYPLPTDGIRSILTQILRGVQYLHAGNCIHRDLKSDNILVHQVGENYFVKVGDYGLSKELAAVDAALANSPATSVVTPSYKAPELLLGYNDYNGKIDHWSIGCIFLQMLAGRSIFLSRPLRTVMEVIGLPTQESMGIPFTQEMNNRVADAMIAYQGAHIGLHGVIPEEDVEDRDNAMDLARRLLALNPEERISFDEALAHPYLAGMSAATRAALPDVASIAAPGDLVCDFEADNALDSLCARVFNRHLPYFPELEAAIVP